MVGQEGERSSLVKVAGLGIVVVLLIAGAVYVVGELVDDKTTNTDTEYEKSDGTGDSPQAADENDDNRPDWLIKKTDLFGNEKYVIDREKLSLEGLGYELVYGGDDNYDDNDMKPNDGIPEMMAGIDVENGNVIFVIDKDLVEQHGGVSASSREHEDSSGFRQMIIDYKEATPDIRYAEVQMIDNAYVFSGEDPDNKIDYEKTPFIGYLKVS